jgi:outer membrane protein assembly factor BamB
MSRLAAQVTGSSTGLTSLAVSPDGSTVFVTGYTSYQGDDTRVLAILAYNAATGAKLWQVTGQTDIGIVSPVVVSPDSSTVYVTYSPWADDRLPRGHRCGGVDRAVRRGAS